MTSEQRRIAPREQPRQARAEPTRQRIRTAAAHAFGEHGYAAGTTNRIAERARISIGSLYQYCPDKDAILAELPTRHLDGDQGAEVVRVRDTDTAARLVATTVEMTVHQLIAAPGSIDTTRLENELVAMVTGYLKAG
ncbi:AcrR family transcriptional regulator [Crossiella equi]|uniref:AcrR family transcriptional regulator n=1 Tax=Crossiella equi TaxID=130796 RepID=A0ABS5AAA7_9PSEU|nr:TetR/AcrR family transcriptional regulator [Crossiella equi]MBP2473139.1 AcrR family transcriptional regulator [Crossiella equi]